MSFTKSQEEIDSLRRTLQSLDSDMSHVERPVSGKDSTEHDGDGVNEDSAE